jgi:hypothetical protein
VRWPKVMNERLMNHRLTDWALSPVDFPGSFPLASRFLRFALTAITALLFSFSSQWAIAQTNPTSPSTSARATADKGGWQVVNIDWVSYTFAKIAGMDSSERKRLQLLKKLWEIWKLKEYQEWSSNEVEAAKQREAEADARIEELNKQLVARYEQYISNIERWARWECEIVERIANADFAPRELKQKANAVLNNKRDTMISPASK